MSGRYNPNSDKDIKYFYLVLVIWGVLSIAISVVGIYVAFSSRPTLDKECITSQSRALSIPSE